MLHRPRKAPLRTALAVAAAILAFGCGDPDPNWVNDRLLPPEPVLTYCVGAQVEDFCLDDTDGTSHSIEAYRGHIVVLEFWGCRCPHVERTEKARQRLIAHYAPRDVVYLAVDSNRDEYPEEIRQYLADHGSSYTILLDFASEIARRFNASRTPQVFALDGDGVVRYIGRPFSSEQWARDEPERADWLEAAIEALLAGQSPDPAMRPPVGSKIRKLPPP